MNHLRIPLLVLLAFPLCLAAPPIEPDEMWDTLLNHGSLPSIQAGEDLTADPLREDSAPLDFARRLRDMRMPVVDAVEWPDANLAIRLGDGWRHLPTPMLGPTVRMYQRGESINFMLILEPLAKNSPLSVDAVHTLQVETKKHRLKNIRKLTPCAAAAALDMRVSSADVEVNGLSVKAIFSTIVRHGAVYVITLNSLVPDDLESEFQRLIADLRFPDPEADLSKPAVHELSLPVAGLTIPVHDLHLVEIPSEIPQASTARSLECLVAIMSFDLSDCAPPLRDCVDAFTPIYENINTLEARIDETTWGGLPAIQLTGKEPIRDITGEMDWRAVFAMHEGTLCIAMIQWPKGHAPGEAQATKALAATRFHEKTPAPAEIPEESLPHLAMIYNQIGSKTFERGQYGLSSNAFERAARMAPGDPVVHENLLQSLTSQGRFQPALAAVERAREHHPDHESFIQWHATLLARAGRHADASPLFEQLFANGSRDLEFLSLWIDSLQSSGRADKATEIARTGHAESGHIQWQRTLANCLWTEGLHEEALTHFDAIAPEFAGDAGFAGDHAALMVDAGEFRRAIDLANTWEKSGPATAPILFSKGMAASGLGWFKDAVAAFSQVDEMMPGNPTVRDALAQARAMLGQGSRDGYREDLAAATIPTALLENAAATLAANDPASEFPGEAWVMLEDIRVWHWIEGEDAKVTHRRKIRILDTPGITAFSTLYIPLRPDAEHFNIHHMTVTAADGSNLQEFKLGELHVRDANTGLADGRKIICIPVPTLSIGAVIDFEYTIRHVLTAERFPMTTETLTGHGPAVYAAVAFTGEADKLRFASTADLASPALDDGTAVFEARMARRQYGAAHLPSADEWCGFCWATDARTTWQEDAATYNEEIRECIEDDAFATQAAADLKLADMPRPEALRALVRWLNLQFQYQGIEFGRRARMPARGADTLSRGYGDCKDLSVMARAILLKAGIEARLALVHSGGMLREDVPGLDQFDHMVVYLPGESDGDGLILDPTLRHFNTPEALVPHAIGRRALVLEGGKPEFITMRENPDVARTTRIDRTVHLTGDGGDASVGETITVSPAIAVGLRMAISATPTTDRRRLMEGLLRGRDPRVDFESFECDALDDPFAPFVMRLGYVVRDAFSRDGRTVSGNVPFILERMLFEIPPDQDRNIALHIATSEQCISSTRFHLPDGHTWSPPEELRTTASASGFIEGTLEWTPADDGAHLQATFSLHSGAGGVDDFQALQRTNQQLLRALERRILIHRP